MRIRKISFYLGLINILKWKGLWLIKNVYRKIKKILPFLGIPLLIAAIVFALSLLLWFGPEKILTYDRNTFKATEPVSADQINEYRKTLAQIIGGIVLLIGVYFTVRQIRATERTVLISQEGQITERFTRAVDQLGSDKLEVRLGGIYALERIAKDSKKDHPQIMEILTAYVRERSPVDINKGKPKNKILNKVAVDIQAILTVIGRRNIDFDIQSIYLSNTFLVEADLREANLQKTNFWEANLQAAFLKGTNLQEAILRGTNLQRTYLGDANLRKAYLMKANLQNAILCDADLQEANLLGINLQEVDLRRANFQEAYLGGANLQEADLEGANLSSIQSWKNIKSMDGAIIKSVKNAPDGFIEFAKSKGAIEEP